MNHSSYQWEPPQPGTSLGSRDPQRLTSESLSPEEILKGKVEDLEHRVARLEGDIQGVEFITETLKDEIAYIIRKIKGALNFG